MCETSQGGPEASASFTSP